MTIASGMLTSFISFETTLTTDSQEVRGLPGALFHCDGVGIAIACLGCLFANWLLIAYEPTIYWSMSTFTMLELCII